jgi:hypothetical protein
MRTATTKTPRKTVDWLRANHVKYVSGALSEEEAKVFAKLCRVRGTSMMGQVSSLVRRFLQDAGAVPA